MEDDVGADSAELRELKAAVFGRDAASLPEGERAELESRLALLLANADAERRAAEAERRVAEAERARVASAPAVHGDPVAEDMLAAFVVPESVPSRRTVWARVLRHPLVLVSLASVLIVSGTLVGAELAEQARDSLAVFQAPPTDRDALPDWATTPDRPDSRSLGQLAGYAVFGALTEADSVCLIAIDPLSSSGAGTCVSRDDFAAHGARLEMSEGSYLGPGNSVILEWGPRGPARLVGSEASSR